MRAKRRQAGRRQRRVAEVDEATIRLHIEALKEGGYVATSPDVPGLVAEGRSVMEVVEIAEGLTRKILESCLEHGDPLPPAPARVSRSAFDLLVPVGIR
jgi:predicted RNase H-like HicB family nuclease